MCTAAASTFVVSASTMLSNQTRMDQFCSQLTGDALTACRSIPERCVSLQAPPFRQVVGEPELFVMIKKVVREADLGTHRFFVLGPGRGTTATHETAQASSDRRKVLHYVLVYGNGKPLPENAASIAANGVVKAVHSYCDSLRFTRGSGPASTQSTSTAVLWPTLEQGLRTIMVKQNVSGLFDSPWVNLFSELYLAMCARDVRVVFSTREAAAWGKSRHEDHGMSATGFVCPFAEDPRLLDPFSWPQCAAFTRRYASSVGDHTNSSAGAAREAAPKRLPGARAAYDIKDLTTDTLGKAMEKYNAYVLKLVPDDLLLEVDFFSSKLNEQKPGSRVSPRDEWTRLEMSLIEAFTRDG